MVLKKKSNNKIKTATVFSLVLACCGIAEGQVHTPFLSDRQWSARAAELYQQQLYPLAAMSAQNALGKRPGFYLDNDPLLDKDRATYYSQVAAIRSGTPVAPYFTANPAYRDRIAFATAQYYFSQGKWLKAIPEYEKAHIDNLSNEEIVVSKFELAYAYFNNRQFSESEALLAGIKDLEGPYADKASYYYGLLAYNKGNYADALKSFAKIEQLKDYQSVVPYYIAEIYYFSGERSKALQKAKQELGKSSASFYQNELNLLAAQCLFEENDFKAAIPYFEYYYNHVDRIRKQDMYKMAYSYYRTQQWQKAVEPFQQLSTVQDSLGQAAMYYLGDCYLKTNNKTGAKNAFLVCSQMPYDATLAEHALLLSGKLSFELGYSSEGIAQLKKLLNDYPNTDYHSEAANILSEQLLRSGNYNEAYQLLRSTENPTPALVQKITFGLSMQRLQQNNWEEADQLLDETLSHPEDEAFDAAAHFWKAEIHYHNKNFRAAISEGKAFLEKNTAPVTSVSTNATRQNALMTLGYAALNAGEFSLSRNYFEQAQTRQSGSAYSAKLAAEAALREADAAFLQKDYARAAELYNKTITQNTGDADYARFQKSTLLGLQGKSAEQADLLMQIVAQKNPESKYKYEAHYALGDLYLDANKFEDAINNFQKVNERTAKHLAAKALMKTAFAYGEADNDQKAIETYKAVIAAYPNTEQRTAALEALKDLYVSNNQPDAYVRLLKEYNLGGTDNAGVDSLFYAAAETQFAAGHYAKASEAMRNYLAQYPSGVFRTKANFYKAESHYQLKEYDSAAKDYDRVLQEAWSDFTEPAAVKAAGLAYTRGDYSKAAIYYGLLRNNAVGKDNLKAAYKGLMLSAAKQEQPELAGNYADTLLSLPEPGEATQQEAWLIKGNAALKNGRYQQADTLFAQAATAKNTEIAAEACYKRAELVLQQNKISEAEQAAAQAIRQTAGSTYWNTKSYLLMADIFVAQKDYFNAKATLQSIIKNVKNETLRKEAAGRLEQVKVLEKNKSKLSEG